MARLKLVLAVILIAINGSAASATLVTSITETSGCSQVIDLVQFAGGPSIDVREPVLIDTFPDEDILVRPGTAGVPRIHDGIWGLGDNGIWNSGRAGFIATNGIDRRVSMRIEFERADPVSELGVLLNYVPGYLPTIISALGDNFGVLEQYTVDEIAPISTPNQENTGAFRGFKRSTNDIRAIHFSGSFVVVDDIRFFRSPSQPLHGDTNQDGCVTIDDLNNVRNHFGAGDGVDRSGIPGDTVPFDGFVNIDDLNAVRNHFGDRLAVPVPEPGTLCLVVLGALVLFLFGRGRALRLAG